jgi:hypothetical protein
MAELLNSSRPLEVGSRRDSAATLLTDPVPADILEPAPEILAAAHSPLQADAHDSAKFREEMRRRCEAPLLVPRRHDGLNE